MGNSRGVARSGRPVLPVTRASVWHACPEGVGMTWWWLKLLRYALPQAKRLALILFLMLVGIGIGLLAPWPLKLIVDHVLSSKPLPPAVSWLTGLPAGGTPRVLLLWISPATGGLFVLR